MKSDHQKMRGLIAAVIARANLMEINWHNGAWDIQRALKLYGVVKHLFAYPSNQPKYARTIRLAGGLFTIYMKNGKIFASGAGMVIGVGVEDIERDLMTD